MANNTDIDNQRRSVETRVVSDTESNVASPLQHAHQQPQDEGSLDAWLAIAGSFLVYFSSFGIMNSFGYFQDLYLSGFLRDYAASEIALIGTMQLALMYLTGPVVGSLYDAYGTKVGGESGDIIYIHYITPFGRCCKVFLTRVVVSLSGWRLGLLSLLDHAFVYATQPHMAAVSLPRPIVRSDCCFRCTTCSYSGCKGVQTQKSASNGSRCVWKQCRRRLLSNHVLQISPSYWVCVVSSSWRANISFLLRRGMVHNQDKPQAKATVLAKRFV